MLFVDLCGNMTNTLRSRHTIDISLFLLIITVMGYILIFNPFQKIPPGGVPLDYFDMVAELENNKEDYLIYTNAVHLPQEVESHQFNTVSDINGFSSATNRFIILDVVAYGEISETDIDLLKTLYIASCFHIIILNMSENCYPLYADLVRSENKDEGFIMLTFDVCGGERIQGVMNCEFQNDDEWVYAVLDMILDMASN